MAESKKKVPPKKGEVAKKVEEPIVEEEVKEVSITLADFQKKCAELAVKDLGTESIVEFFTDFNIGKMARLVKVGTKLLTYCELECVLFPSANEEEAEEEANE